MMAIARILAILGILSLAVPSAAAASPSPGLANAIGFREAIGFRADPAYVDSLERDRSAIRAYAVAMTEAEDHEMARREDLSGRLASLQAQLAPFPAFAGLYIDQKTGGIADIAFTQMDPAALALLRAGLRGDDPVRVRMVNYSFADLRKAQETVTADMQELAREGLALDSVAVDIPSNRVVVETSAPLDAATSLMTRRYGAMVEVRRSELRPTEAACGPYNCPNPWKGGLSISSSNGKLATSGYFHKLNGAFYLITAGHAVVASDENWYHNGQLIGKARYYSPAGSADAALITTSENGPKNQYLAYQPGYSTVIGSYTGWRAGTNQVVGEFICKAGGTTFWTCGTITNVDVTEGNRYHLNKASLRSQGGDSGGPVVGGGGVLLYGEISLSLNYLYSWYVPPNQVNLAFGGWPCYTATC